MAEDKRNSPSGLTKLLNTIEAHRNNVASHFSDEYKYARCGCWMCEKSNSILPSIEGSEGPVWSQKEYGFLRTAYSLDDTRLSVHPTLWNNGASNLVSGVFEVLPGRIYQVRGYDMANITFVKCTADTQGIDGLSNVVDDAEWIVMDTLMSMECTKAALELFEAFLNKRYPLDNSYKLMSSGNTPGKIAGMIISHSHIDHFGGMAEVQTHFTSTDCPIYAPEGFLKHSASENIYVGNAMGRRASYQYGSFIKPQSDTDTKGSVSIGIGQGQSTGTVSLLPATEEITANCAKTVGSGKLEIKFQLTPGTEAPAEMNCYFPKYKALWLAENCNGSLHNLYTLRGAQVRDGKDWAKYLVEAAELYGDDAEVIFQSHNWPHWKKMQYHFISGDGLLIEEKDLQNAYLETDLKTFILDTAAIYKYINDQTLLYMNQGYKMNEVADMLTIPRKLQKNWCLKPFYGTPKHNAKAVYQKYLGWYDANPIHLAEIPPEQLAQEIMRYMEMEGTMLGKIQKDYISGNYWTAAYMAQQIIFGSSDADDIASAKMLCADALEQLGYQAESGTWRNAYLSAAYELRNGKGRVSASGGAAMLQHLTPEMILDYIGILFDGERASSLGPAQFLLKITDESDATSKDMPQYFVIHLRHGAFMYYRVPALDEKKYKENDAYPVSRQVLLQLVGMTQSMQPRYTKAEIKAACEKASLPEIFTKVICSMVNISPDRYKYFDIVDKHDVEVEVTEDGTAVNYNLRDYVKKCIAMLEGYYDSVASTPYDTLVKLQPDDLTEWKTNYYRILHTEAGIITESDSMTFGNGGCDGIGNDGAFRKYEYCRTLYELYRYLAYPHVNNTVGSGSEAIRTIAAEIRMVESYVPDFYYEYLGDTKGVVTFEDGDMEAWQNCFYSFNGEQNICDSEFFAVDAGSNSLDQMGVGFDGKFCARELIHLVYELHKALYKAKVDPTNYPTNTKTVVT